MAQPSPRARRSAGAAYYDGAFHVLGGFGVGGTVRPDDVGADLWRYDEGWSLVAQDGPPPARFPSLCAAPEGIYRFGGCGHDGRGLCFLAELWLYDGAWTPVEPKAGPRPAGRYTSALAWHGGRLILFGGHAQAPTGERKVFFDDLWLFDGESRSWACASATGGGPGPRYGFGWVAGGGTLYLFGGFDGHADRGDLWALDLERLRWRRLAADGPAPRYCPALGMVEDRLVLFGGRSKTDPKLNFADSWEFSVGSSGGWRKLDDNGPGYHAKSAFASGGGGLWLFGGEGPRGHVSDLWRFGASGWRRLAPARPDDPVLW